MVRVRIRLFRLCYFLSPFVLLAWLSGAVVSAQAPSSDAGIQGAVLDPLAARVPGATVTLLHDGHATAETQADAHGHFGFAHLAPGRYQLSASAPGFQPRTLDPFVVGTGAALTVDVTLQLGLQEDVVVTASATATPASQVGSAVTVVDHTTLDALATPDVSEALRLAPGTNVAQSGARGALTSLFVRGGASNFTKVLIDGVEANDIGGAVDLSDLATTGLDRVELLREPNSVLYGSDALTGVLSLTTRRGRTRVPELSASVDAGTLHTGRQDVSLGGVVGRFDYFVDASHFQTDNRLPNNAYHNRTFASRVGWSSGRGTTVSVTARRADGTYGSPNSLDFFGIPDDSSRTSHATYAGVEFQSILGGRWIAHAQVTSLVESYRDVNPTATGEPFDPFGAGPNYLGRLVTITGANGYSVTGQAILDYGSVYPQPYETHTTRRAGSGQITGQVLRGVDLTIGGRAEHEEGSTDYTGSHASTSRTNGGAFVEARVSGHRLFATGGLAYDHNAIFRSAVTPRVSVAFYVRRPSEGSAFGATKLTFNAGTGIKAPNISQELSSLYAVVTSLPASARPTLSGLSPIGPERNRSVDAGVEQELASGRGRLRVSFFRNQFSDLIEYVSAGALPALGIPAAVAAATGYGAYVNSSSYWARGVEVSGELAVGPFVRVTGSYTHLHAVVTKSFASSALAPAINPAFPGLPIGQYGPLVGAAPFRRPANAGNLLVAFTRGRADAAVAASFVGRSDDSTFLSDGYFGTSLLLPNHDLNAGYQKVDVSAAYRATTHLRWYVSVENVLDQTYEMVFGFPALPRTVRTGVTIALGGDHRP